MTTLSSFYCHPAPYRPSQRQGCDYWSTAYNSSPLYEVAQLSSYQTLQHYTPQHRFIKLPPTSGQYCNNVTECCLYNEWDDISRDVLIKSNQIRCLTGEKLKRFCEDAFSEKIHKTSGTYFIKQRYCVYEKTGIPICWRDTLSPFWGEDMVSLWAYHNNINYTHAVQHVFAHLQEHEQSTDFHRDDKKGYWVPELTPLALDMHVPWALYAPITVFGGQIYNYFRNGILVGSACTIPHHKHGELTVFFTLMRHTRTREVRWFPMYPTGTDLFFQEDIDGAMNHDLVFLPDEAWAYKESDQWSQKSIDIPSWFLNPVPMACPGGIERLPTMDLSIVDGKAVHILMPKELQTNEQFLAELGKKCQDSNAASLTFYSGPQPENISLRNNSQTDNVLHHIGFQASKEILAISANTGITPPGDPIPGSDIERHEVLSPFIESGQLIWLYGPEKSGKSYFARSLAHVISYGGQFLGNYQAPAGLKVLYIDSEMAPDKLEQAFSKELAGLGYTDGRKFSVKSAKARDNPTGEINLLETEWRQWFNEVIPGYDVIILDCYYSLTRSSMGAKELLQLINPWKSKGKTFVVVDHTNKEGELHGSADKKRATDLCIKITPTDNIDIEISFPVARYLGPEDTQPFVLRKFFTETQFYFRMVERMITPEKTLSDADLRMALAYVCVKKKGCTVVEVAAWLNYGKSSIYPWVSEVEKRLKENTGTNSTALLKKIQTYSELDVETLEQEAKKLKKKTSVASDIS